VPFFATISFGAEAAKRPRPDYENEAQARGRDIYYVPLARLKNHSEFLSGLTSKRYRAQAMFGPGIGDAFQSLYEVVAAVQAHLPWLDAHWSSGCRNAAELWRRLKERGHGAPGLGGAHGAKASSAKRSAKI
jgi:hypothetical protein